jgi:hypothetical protein
MEYLKKKLESSYNKDTEDAIKLISVNSKNTTVIGTAGLKNSIYSGDIDLIERVEIKAPTKLKACQIFHQKLKKILKDIKNSPKALLGDIKGGYYTSGYNLLQLCGEIKDNQIINYKPDELRKEVIATIPLAKDLTKADYEEGNYGSREEFLSKIYDNPTIQQYIELKELLRLETTIRWSYDEVMKNKILTIYNKDTNKWVDRPFSFADAIERHKAFTKIDILYEMPERIIEVTNVYFLYWINNKNQKISINLDPFNKKNEFEYQIKNEILKITEGKKKNYLKALKRIIAIMRKEKDLDGLNKAMPIINGDCGLLYQVIGDINSLIFYIENSTSIPYKYILNEIDLFRSRLSTIAFSFNELKVDNLILSILNKKKIDYKYIVNVLEEIKDILFPILNKQTKQELIKIDLFPIPLKYLP